MENTNKETKKDIIELAREIGRQLQAEPAYINYNLAKEAADNDENLQKLIEEFNLKRVDISSESAKPQEERDNEKIRSLNKEMRAAYARIMTNENMMKFNDSKDELDMILKRVSAIIQKSSEGEDPETADYIPTGCSGSCSTCGGCG